MHIATPREKQAYNLSSGPAMMPRAVLERAREEMLDFDGLGISVMEISHRSSEFEGVLERAQQGIRELLAVPSNYKILFFQGGASLQFSMVPMNFLQPGGHAEYVITGAWGEKAVKEASRAGNARVVCSTAETGFRSVPKQDELRFDANAAYIHYTSNETIHGLEFKYDLDGGGVPVVCDASSNILSKPIDVEKYALIYAGAQKNIGPSGVTVVIIRDDMLAAAPMKQYSMLDYRAIAENRSMLNTPNTWGVYLISLVCEWLREQGGLDAMGIRNEKKAAIIYEAIDSSDGFYRGHADRDARSAMNVTFRLASEDLDKRFADTAEVAGFHRIRGHRSVGGIRASIYNAFPTEGCEAFASFMREFQSEPPA